MLVHVDDMIIGGTDEAVAKITDHLMKRYKVSIEEGRTINVDASATEITVNEKYIHNLVKLMSPLRRSKTVEVDGAEMKESDERRTTYRQRWGLCSTWQETGQTFSSR